MPIGFYQPWGLPSKVHAEVQATHKKTNRKGFHGES